MSRFEYLLELIRSNISTNLMALSLYVMPEGPVKDALLISIENTLNKVILDFDKGQ